MPNKKHIHRIGKYLLLLLYLQFYSGITMFYHAHLINGHVVCHSHPYWPFSKKKKPYQRQQHSKGELILIKHLNHALWKTGPLKSTVPKPVFRYLRCQVFSYFNELIRNFYSLPLLRAPPKFSFAC